jgi:hypothetical protein
MKHHWIFPELDERSVSHTHLGSCSGCGAEIRVDPGPSGGARQHYRWSPDANFGPKKLGPCPATAKHRFRVERTTLAHCLGVAIDRRTGRRTGFARNNADLCDAQPTLGLRPVKPGSAPDPELTPWDVRRALELHPEAFVELP